MKIGHFLPTALLVLGAWTLPLESARADTVLYDSSSFVQGQQSFVQALDITAPGTLTVTLSNIPWLDTVTDLNLFLTSTSGVIGTPNGPGTETFSVGPGTLYAHWFGQAQGPFDVGVVGVKIDFQPSAIAPVPLPDSVILLLSGLLFLAAWFGPRWRVASRGSDGAVRHRAYNLMTKAI
jgi:hypothetical protein